MPRNVIFMCQNSNFSYPLFIVIYRFEEKKCSLNPLRLFTCLQLLLNWKYIEHVLFLEDTRSRSYIINILDPISAFENSNFSQLIRQWNTWKYQTKMPIIDRLNLLAAPLRRSTVVLSVRNNCPWHRKSLTPCEIRFRLGKNFRNCKLIIS